MLILLRWAVAVAVAVVAVAIAGVAAAQSWPAKPVRLVVGYPAGGLTDGVARTLAPRLAETLGQQVIVDNRSGGGSAPRTR